MKAFNQSIGGGLGLSANRTDNIKRIPVSDWQIIAHKRDLLNSSFSTEFNSAKSPPLHRLQLDKERAASPLILNDSINNPPLIPIRHLQTAPIEPESRLNSSQSLHGIKSSHSRRGPLFSTPFHFITSFYAQTFYSYCSLFSIFAFFSDYSIVFYY